MSRDPYRDEATLAYRALTRGEETEDTPSALIALSVLVGDGKTGIRDAVRYVYGGLPEKPYKGAIDGRVTKYCADTGLMRKTVYRYLKIARETFSRVKNPSID